MNAMTILSPKPRIQTIIRCMAIAVTLMAIVIMPVYGAPGRGNAGHGGHARGGGDRDWRGHEGRAHGYWDNPEPGVIYAPPVVYSPVPEYAEPGINLIVPLHIR